MEEEKKIILAHEAPIDGELDHKDNSTKYNVNKKSKSKKKKRKLIQIGNLEKKKKSKFKNPGITRFNINSHFIFDLSKSEDFISQIEDKNTIKLSSEESKILLNEIGYINELINKKENTIFISLQIQDIKYINDYFDIKEEGSGMYHLD